MKRVKLTKKQRAQVVELLRCTADRLLDGCSFIWPLHDAMSAIHGSPPKRRRSLVWVLRDAQIAAEVVRPKWIDNGTSTDGAFALLEAAQRVEEGSWP
mgnify:CR=1 FL=1